MEPFLNSLLFFHKLLRQLEKHWRPCPPPTPPPSYPPGPSLGSCPDAERDPVCTVAQGWCEAVLGAGSRGHGEVTRKGGE